MWVFYFQILESNWANCTSECWQVARDTLKPINNLGVIRTVIGKGPALCFAFLLWFRCWCGIFVIVYLHAASIVDFKSFWLTISKPIVQIWNQCDFMQVPSSMSVHYKHICKNHFGETLSFVHRNTLAIPHIRFHFGRILAVLVDSLQNGVMPQVVLPCRVRIPGSAWMSAQLNHHSKLLFGKILVFAVFFCEFIC